MTPTTTGTTLNLTDEERSYLLTWLEQLDRNKRVEEHRTESFDARKVVMHEQEVLANLINKLRR